MSLAGLYLWGFYHVNLWFFRVLAPQPETALAGSSSVKRRRVDFVIDNQHGQTVSKGNSWFTWNLRDKKKFVWLCCMFCVDGDGNVSEDFALADVVQGVSALSGLITSGAEDQNVEPLLDNELFCWLLLMLWSYTL